MLIPLIMLLLYIPYLPSLSQKKYFFLIIIIRYNRYYINIICFVNNIYIYRDFSLKSKE